MRDDEVWQVAWASVEWAGWGEAPGPQGVGSRGTGTVTVLLLLVGGRWCAAVVHSVICCTTGC